MLLVHALLSKKEITTWSKMIHESCVKPKGVPDLGSLGLIEGSSDITMNALNDTLVQVKLAIMHQNNLRY